MRRSILLSCLSTFIWAETITLAPIDIQEKTLSSGTVVHCRVGIKNMLDEAYEWEYGYPTSGRTYYDYVEWKL